MAPRPRERPDPSDAPLRGRWSRARSGSRSSLGTLGWGGRPTWAWPSRRSGEWGAYGVYTGHSVDGGLGSEALVHCLIASASAPSRRLLSPHLGTLRRSRLRSHGRRPFKQAIRLGCERAQPRDVGVPDPCVFRSHVATGAAVDRHGPTASDLLRLAGHAPTQKRWAFVHRPSSERGPLPFGTGFSPARALPPPPP